MASQRPRRGEGPALGLGSSSDVNVSLNWQGAPPCSRGTSLRVPSPSGGHGCWHPVFLADANRQPSRPGYGKAPPERGFSVADL